MATFMKSYKTHALLKDLDNKKIEIQSNSDHTDRVVLEYDESIGNSLKQALTYLQNKRIKAFFYTEVDSEYVILSEHTLVRLKGGEECIKEK